MIWRQLKENHKSANKSVTDGHEKLAGVLTFCIFIFFLLISRSGNSGIDSLSVG